MADRPVKVVLLAGSIGAHADEPYGRLLHQWCSRAEIRNLSRVGFGAYELYDLLGDEVLRNGRLHLEGVETWLLWNGGLNSARASYRTNHYIRLAFQDAHRAGLRVVGMSLTPWGSLDDDRRWGEGRGWHTLTATRRVVDFVMGRLGPREALGDFAPDRDAGADAPWRDEERADVRIDLYDSSLRDRDAALRDLDEMRRYVRNDPRWRRTAEHLAEDARAARLEADAQRLDEAPRWFLRRELRAFDPVHPNRLGHREIASIACPSLPASWGCSCPAR
jgi:hypothetical protein